MSSRRLADVTVGEQLPPLAIPLTRTLIVATAIASRDYQDVHHDPDLARIVVRGNVQSGERDDAMPLSGDWEQIRGGAQLYAEAGVTELFYDLNWDPAVGGPEADPAAAAERAEEIITALAPTANPY